MALSYNFLFLLIDLCIFPLTPDRDEVTFRMSKSDLKPSGVLHMSQLHMICVAYTHNFGRVLKQYRIHNIESTYRTRPDSCKFVLLQFGIK